MKKKIWIVVSVVVIIVGLFGANVWVKAKNGNFAVEVATLKEKTVTNKVMTQGTLKLAEEQTIYFNSEKGEIDEILVNERADVTQGAPLLKYKNDQLVLEQKQNQLQLQASNLEVKSLQEQYNQLEKQLKEDKENETLQSERNQVKLQLQQANLEIQQLQLQKDSINQKIADLEVKSDISGKVVEVNKQAAVVSNQMEPEPLIRIGSLNQLIVEGVISEYDTLNIKEGQVVTLKSEAVPDKSWTGKVSQISYLPEEASNTGTDGGARSVQYPIEVVVEDQNIDLKPGFQMIVEITTDQYKAKTLPISAVKQDGDVNYVYVVKDGKVEKRNVTIGTTSSEMIEIKDGITVKEQVITNPDKDITEGMEVTIK